MELGIRVRAVNVKRTGQAGHACDVAQQIAGRWSWSRREARTKQQSSACIELPSFIIKHQASIAHSLPNT